MSTLDTLALVLRIADLAATIALLAMTAFAPSPRRALVPIVAIALMLPLLRLLIQAALIGDVANVLWPLIADTRYGQVMIARVAIVAIWFAVFCRAPRRGTALGFAALDIGAMALLGHGAASAAPLAGAAVLGLHIGAACLWISGMASVLFGRMRHVPGSISLQGFAPLGLACVALLVGTGLLNLQIVTGDMALAFTGSYGAILIAKLICFAAMVIMAAINRFALLPRIAGATAHRATLALALETLLGGVVIGLASLLASGPPGG